MSIVTRFAPSPTGHLHIGGARTAIFCWLMARHFGGKFLLRIEDTDVERSKQEYTDSIISSMRWLGLDWDDELFYQSRRLELYNAYVDKLLDSGHAYWCECTPEEVEAMREKARIVGGKPRYNRRCRERGLGPGAGRAVRLKAPLSGKIVFDDMIKGHIAVDADELDDMVLRRSSDGMPVYNMAVVVDDFSMKVTHVLRGDDHVNNTHKQILIYQALGIPVPVFGHVPMILGPDRQKLSKRHGAKAVIEYCKDGLLPEALLNYLVRLGWSHGDQELFTRTELIEQFNGNNLNKSSACFDPEKLLWVNSQHMRQLDNAALAEKVFPFTQAECLDTGKAALERLAPLFQSRSTNLLDLARQLKLVLTPAEKLTYNSEAVARTLDTAGKGHLEKLLNLFSGLKNFDQESAHEALQNYVNSNSLKFKQVAPPLRVALLGCLEGPDLSVIMEALGLEETQKRLQHALKL